MFNELLKTAGRYGTDGSPSKIPAEISRCLPPGYSLQDISDGIIGSQASGDIASLRALQACLRSENLTKPSQGDDEAFTEIADYVARSIAPVATASGATDSTEWEDVAFKGVIGLSVLETLCDEARADLGGGRVLLAMTAFTNSQDPWTTKESSTLSQALLNKQLVEAGQRTEFITEIILNGFLRTQFSKSRPSTITASGRKAEFIEATRYGSMDAESDETSKPWKHKHRYAITIFEWAVLNAGEELMSKHWHLFTPVMLTLLDESQTDIKIRALQIFSAYWTGSLAGLMAKVGLVEVFEQAVFPAVLYLPTLTPEDESLRILDVTYPALFRIAGLPYPEDRIGEPAIWQTFSESQKKSFDKIMREGILTGYFHANEYIHLTELLCIKARFLVNGMGILAVKYLKDLIPIISEITSDPFGTKHLPAVLAAIQLLQAIMRCCWPRIKTYCDEIIRILTVCYLNIEDEDSFPVGPPSKGHIKSQLARAAETLAAVMKSEDTNLFQRVSPLIEKEPVLAKLFKPQKTC
ncbi:hypothetical protein BJ170DRAFT_679875 [Xylariales sp. AK1849]|nr:hypothetical protein BJ170DRAFT_679875 [Xylariales sp. AK1849]